jgi:hypothetical protein
MATLIRPILRCFQTNANHPRNMGAVRPPSAKRPITQEDNAHSIRTFERKRDNLSLLYGEGVSTEPVSLQGHHVTKHVRRFGTRPDANPRGVSGQNPTPNPAKCPAFNTSASAR